MSIKPLSTAIGAEIFGVDLARPLTESTVIRLRQAFLTHHVLFFRDQELAPPALCGFARHFGSLDSYPFVAGLEDCPEVVEIIKEPHQTSNFGGIWHTDTSYLAPPSAPRY